MVRTFFFFFSIDVFPFVVLKTHHHIGHPICCTCLLMQWSIKLLGLLLIGFKQQCEREHCGSWPASA